MFKGESGVLKVFMRSMVVMKSVRKNDLYALECVVYFDSTSTITNRLIQLKYDIEC